MSKIDLWIKIKNCCENSKARWKSIHVEFNIANKNLHIKKFKNVLPSTQMLYHMFGGYRCLLSGCSGFLPIAQLCLAAVMIFPGGVVGKLTSKYHFAKTFRGKVFSQQMIQALLLQAEIWSIHSKIIRSFAGQMMTLDACVLLILFSSIRFSTKIDSLFFVKASLPVTRNLFPPSFAIYLPFCQQLHLSLICHFSYSQKWHAWSYCCS